MGEHGPDWVKSGGQMRTWARLGVWGIGVGGRGAGGQMGAGADWGSRGSDGGRGQMECNQ